MAGSARSAADRAGAQAERAKGTAGGGQQLGLQEGSLQGCGIASRRPLLRHSHRLPLPVPRLQRAPRGRRASAPVARWRPRARRSAAPCTLWRRRFRWVLEALCKLLVTDRQRPASAALLCARAVLRRGWRPLHRSRPPTQRTFPSDLSFPVCFAKFVAGGGGQDQVGLRAHQGWAAGGLLWAAGAACWGG